MDGEDHPALSPKKPFLLQRSASFSASTHRTAVPPPPPLSISRPSLHWPPPSSAHPDSACRRGQLAFFDRECSRVEDHLYLGSDIVARDRDSLGRHGITHVLSCVGSPELFRPDVKYKTLWLADTPGQDITAVLYDVFDYFEEVRAVAGRKVLVHCSRGVSRSAALVVAYLMWRHALPFDAALRKVRAARPVTDPNLGFASQLLSFQNRILCRVDTPSYRCRLYRMAPHSPYDPLHLVPKPLDHHPSPADLDSRGAFVLQACSAVYVWIGSNCEEIMACSARTAASQLVRYEHAVEPVADVDEGSEPADFWDLFEDCSERLWSAGTRRVEAYDLDFDIFLRAMKGGVVPPFMPPVVPGSPARLPSKGGGWLRFKQKLLTGGDKDSVPLLEDRELEPFGSPQSSLSRDLSTPTSSDFSTLSPASSSSDWCNSPSSGSELFYEGELFLSSSGVGKSPPSPSGATSLARGRVAGASSPSFSRQEEVGEHDMAKDWPFSPMRLAEEDGGRMMEIEQPALSDADVMLADEEDGATRLAEPALYQWPNIVKLENLHPGVLDSKSVFLLLAPESSLKKREHKILYVWVGGQSKIHANSGTNDEADAHDSLEKIGHDFLDQMGFTMDITVQVVREEKEPQEFLNHFFTFHQAKDKCNGLEEQHRQCN